MVEEQLNEGVQCVSVFVSHHVSSCNPFLALVCSVVDSANERTFLAWMHLSIILAGASIAILAFSGQSENPLSQIYGVVMLPVAVVFIVYAMYQCECYCCFAAMTVRGQWTDLV